MKKLLILYILLFFILGCGRIDVADVAGKISLEGIAYDGENDLAIVNGEIRRLGDTVEEAEIINITGDYVKFRYKNKLFIKRLNIEGKNGRPKNKNYPKPRKEKIFRENISYNKALNYYNRQMYDEAIREAQRVLPVVAGERNEKMLNIIDKSRKAIWKEKEREAKQTRNTKTYESKPKKTNQGTWIPKEKNLGNIWDPRAKGKNLESTWKPPFRTGRGSSKRIYSGKKMSDQEQIESETIEKELKMQEKEWEELKKKAISYERKEYPGGGFEETIVIEGKE